MILRRLSFLVLCGLLAACGPQKPRADLVFIQSAEPETIDPALAADHVSLRIAFALFEGLCRYDEDGQPQPGMAERWDVSPDGKTYLFHLRDGVKWTDGRAVTAQDFVRSWRRVLDPATGSDYSNLLHIIRGAKAFAEGQNTDPASIAVRAVDARTLEVQLENPTPYFIDLCAFSTFAPVPPDVLERHGTAWMKPANIVCNGSYTLEDWRIDDHIRLKRNPGYWDAANVPMATIEVKPVPDAITTLNAFHTGQCDLMMDKGMVPPSLADEIKKQPWFHTGPLLGTWFIRINTTKPPFTDPRVRQAFALAVDKQRIVQNITKLGEPAADSLTPPGTGHQYQPPPGLPHDVARAQQLLAEAGFPGGKGFPLVEYLYIPQPIERNIAVELQAMWQKNLGVTVNLKTQEQKIWLSSMRSLDYHLCRSSWIGDYNDPGTFLEMFLSDSGNNRTGWKNPDFDALIADAAREPDPAKRNTLFQQAEKRLIHDESVVLPVYFYVGVQFYHDRLTGIRPNLIDDHPFRCMRWR